jgi:hypothetical protein
MALTPAEKRRRNAIALLNMAIVMAACGSEDDGINRPVVTVPSSQYVLLSAAPLVFTSSISVSDAVETSLTIAITFTGGTITLDGTTGLSFSVGDGTADETMTFSGTITNINNALSGMSVTAGSTGDRTLSITATNTTGSRAANVGVQFGSIPVFTVDPAISGDLDYGNTLTCSDGTVTGYPTPTLTRQWQSDGVNISGETGNTYTSVFGDVGDTITCEVTATNAYGSDMAEATGVVILDPDATGNPPPSVEYLVVAGGGGAGGMKASSWAAGGGGAGGYRTATGYTITPGSPITVTVGAGGAGGAAGVIGSKGGDSVFGTITAEGGGYGASDNSGPAAPTNGGNGGSGGGGHRATGTGGTATSGQGNNGGDGSDAATAYGGGGGGGAGGVGAASSGSGAAAGGPGINWNSLGTTYAVGGNGGDYLAADAAGVNGTANRGNGGQAALGSSANAGGNGGSGIVIIRYADTYDLATSTTGSPTQTTTGGYHYYTWTSSGSIEFSASGGSSALLLLEDGSSLLLEDGYYFLQEAA